MKKLTITSAAALCALAAVCVSTGRAFHNPGFYGAKQPPPRGLPRYAAGYGRRPAAVTRGVGVIKLLALITTLALVAAAGTAWPDDETLVGGKLESGGYGGPYLKYSPVGEGWELLVGVRGGWIINHTLVLGAGLCGIVPGAYVIDDTGERDIGMEYGGLEIEYIVDSQKLLHYSFGLLIGGGSVYYKVEGLYWAERDGNSFFVAEPAANVELNVVSFFRINVGLGYRFAAGGEMRGITDSNLRGLAPTLTFKFGSF